MANKIANIDGKHFEFQSIRAVDALKIATKLQNILGVALSSMNGNLNVSDLNKLKSDAKESADITPLLKNIGSILSKITPEDLEFIRFTAAQYSMVLDQATGNLEKMEMEVVFNKTFVDNLPLMYQWMWKFVEVSFLGSLSGLLDKIK